MPSVLWVLCILVGPWWDEPRISDGVSEFLCARWRRGPRVSSCREWRSRPSLCSDLFEQMCLNMGCYLFLTGGDLMETDHLRLLILHLLQPLSHRRRPHGDGSSLSADSPSASTWRKASGGVDYRWVEARLQGLHPEWQRSVRMRVLYVRDVNIW